MDDYLSVGELMELVLSNENTKTSLNMLGVDINKYKEILKDSKIYKYPVSTYEDYLELYPLILQTLKPHITTSEYTKMVLFKTQINSMVFNIFTDLV